jgi:hypothetical protein
MNIGYNIHNNTPGSLLVSARLCLLLPLFVLELNFMGGEVSAVFMMLAHSPRANFRGRVICFLKRARGFSTVRISTNLLKKFNKVEIISTLLNFSTMTKMFQQNIPQTLLAISTESPFWQLLDY